MTTAADPATTPEAFGPYVIYERLGLGGMATVHRAKKQGIAGFERGVALKRMLAHLSEDADFVQSFIREAKVASLLVHPNIAQVYDFGRIDSVYFIAMEHVEGCDVRRLLRHANRTGQAIPLPVVLSILMELCDALEFAHNFRDEHGQPLGIVHRDVSPSNLIVANTGHLKVIDFGIAKASARTLHTESGQAKGKLGYMSPEAAMGNVLGPVSDVFSTGVVAHELLTALPLFTAKTDFETMLRIREGEIDPPSRRNASCPPELDQIVMAALSRDPRHRVPTAGAFRHALDAVAHSYGIRISARDVVEYMGRVVVEPSRTRRETANPYSVDYSLPSSAFPHVGSGSGSVPPGKFEDDLDDWGDVPNPSSRLNVPELSPHFTPTRQHPTMSARMIPAQVPQNLSVSHVFAGAVSGPVQVASLPAPVTPPKSRAALVGVLVALIALVGGAILYVGVIRPDGAPPVAAAAQNATLKLVLQPPDAIVEIGGKVIARDADGAVSLEPGLYSIIVKKEGYVASTSSVSLRAGESTTATIALEQGASVVATVKPVEPVEPVGSASEPPDPSTKVPPRDRTPRRNPRDKTPDKVEIKDDPVPDPGPGSAVTPPPPDKVETPVKPPPPPDKVETPPKPIAPARTPVVAATAVTKLSGEIPAIKGQGESAGQVLAKMCLDASGRVTDVSIKKLTPEVVVQLQSALKRWRYKPYVDPATKQASPVCFPLSFKLVFKKSD